MVIIAFSTQPAVIKEAFSFFRCKNLYREDTPILYLEGDYEVECWKGDHQLYALGVALPYIVFWGVILPLFIFIKLCRNRKNLNNKDLIAKYSFLYCGY